MTPNLGSRRSLSPSLLFLVLEEFVQTARVHFAQPDHKWRQ